VTVRQILAEWARIGGARIVNGEKVAGGPVTIQLNGIPERQALDSILRGVSGYMIAARQNGTGLSAFDRIMILPTSAGARPTGQAANPGFGQRPVAAPMPVRTEPDEQPDVAQDDDRDEPEAVDAEPADPGGEDDAQPAPGGNQRFQQRRPVFPNPMGGAPQGQPYIPQNRFPGPPQPPQQPDEDVPPGQQSTTPMNVPPGASATPGVISPVPQDPQQQPPGRPRRPPQ